MANITPDNALIYDNFDRFTKEHFNAVVVTTKADGSPYTDADVDNVFILKNKPELGGGYSKRAYTGPFNARSIGVVGDGVTDDTDAFLQAARIGNKAKAPILFEPGMVVTVRPMLLENMEYVHLILDKVTLKALPMADASTPVNQLHFNNIKDLQLKGHFVLNGNYPTANATTFLRITAPVSMSGSYCLVESYAVQNLPSSGVYVTTGATATGYNVVRIKYAESINATNKRNAATSNDFYVLNIRGAHNQIYINDAYVEQDNEVWGDSIGNPACKMIQVTAEANNVALHPNFLKIGSIRGRYSVCILLFLQAIKQTEIETIEILDAIKKPGVADSAAYSNAATKAFNFVKFDYAIADRDNSSMKIGKFICRNTNSVLKSSGSNFMAALWMDEGLEDSYVGLIDSDLAVIFHGQNTTTPFSGKHIIDTLIYRTRAKTNTRCAIGAQGTVINTVKIINSNASFTPDGVIKNIIQEGDEQIQFNMLSGGAVKSTEGQRNGTYIGQGYFTNARFTFQHIYSTVTYDGVNVITEGRKIHLRNIKGNVQYNALITQNGSNVTLTTYDGGYEIDYHNYVEQNFENCDFWINNVSTDVVRLFCETKGLLGLTKNLAKTSGWKVPIQQNSFKNTSFKPVAATDHADFRFLNNEHSREITSDYNATLSDYSIRVKIAFNRSSFLPEMKWCKGKRFVYTRVDSTPYNFDIKPRTGYTINGSTNFVTLKYKGDFVVMEADGIDNYVIVSSKLQGQEVVAGTGTVTFSKEKANYGEATPIPASTGFTISLSNAIREAEITVFATGYSARPTALNTLAPDGVTRIYRIANEPVTYDPAKELMIMMRFISATKVITTITQY